MCIYSNPEISDGGFSEMVVARKLETTSFECFHPHTTISESIVEAITNAYNKCIHPHTTISESIVEAITNAYNKCIHISHVKSIYRFYKNLL